MNTAEDHTVDRAELAKFDAVAHRFWDENGEFAALHRLNPVRFEFLAQRCSLRGVRVLDVGCGGGLLAESLARAAARVTAIDLAPAMIEVAKLHALQSLLQIDYRLVPLESLLGAAEPAAGYDVVSCMEMLEHVPEPATTVATLAKLLRPGGQLFISTIHRNLRAFLLAIVGAEYLMNIVPRGTHEYERFIRPSELARWGRAAGLELREIRGLDYNPASRQSSLTPDPAVNYIAQLTRPGSPQGLS
jgi:2-polyprenyl-6-hydroxyphenyl methylase/3-demethylubiquinone-9 3-methyltransferase